MDIEEIIESLDFAARYIEGKQGKTFLLGAFDVKAIRTAIEKLKTHPDNQPNEPLTLEELQELNRPVWVVNFNDEIGCWCLCKKGRIISPSGVVYETDEVNYWKFYRRPPEEET